MGRGARMGAVIRFALTRHHYDSYDVYRQLISLSAFDTCFVDEIRLDSGETYIVTPLNGEVYAHLANERLRVGGGKTARVVWWQLEPPAWPPGGDFRRVMDLAVKNFDAVWICDRWAPVGIDARLRHVVMGSHRGLAPGWSPTVAPTTAIYDFCHMSYAWGRREALYNACVGVGLSMGPPGFGEERDRVMRQSRVMLNAHQYDGPLLLPLRFCLAAAYAMPLVSERVGDPYPLVAGVHFEQAPMDGLVEAVYDLAQRRSPAERREMGLQLHELLCRDWTFRRGVEEGAACVP